MNKQLTLLLLIIFGLLSLTPVLGAEIELKGELTQSLTYGLDEKEFTGAVTDIELSLEQEYGLKGKWFVSFDGNYNTTRSEDEGKFKLGLNEAYGSYYLENTDLTVGRQVINWGTADGINPTNYINPLSMGSFDLNALSGEPVMAAQGIYYADDYDLTGVVVLDFVPQNLTGLSRFKGNGLTPEEEDFYNVLETALTQAYDEQDVQVPNTLENLEFALQGGTMVSGYDLKLSFFHGWEDVPALVLEQTYLPGPGGQRVPAGLPTASARFRRVNKLGLAAAGVIEDYGVWGEAAYTLPEEMDLSTGDPLVQKFSLSINKPYFQVVIGGDYTFENGIYAEGQYLYYGNGSLINPYKLDPAEEVQAGQYLMGRFSYDFNPDNTLELMSILNIDDQSALVVPSYTYRLNQVTDLKLSPVLTTRNGGEMDAISPGVGISLQTVF